MIDWLKANPRGAHIVNIASMAAVVSAPGMAPYNVTKAGMLSFSETLYGELRPYNVGVTAVCPSFFQTNIIKTGRFQTPAQQQAAAKLMASSKCTAEHVAQRILRAVERKRLYVFAPGIATFFWRLKRLMPVSVLKLVARRNAQVSGAYGGAVISALLPHLIRPAATAGFRTRSPSCPSRPCGRRPR